MTLHTFMRTYLRWHLRAYVRVLAIIEKFTSIRSTDCPIFISAHLYSYIYILYIKTCMCSSLRLNVCITHCNCNASVIFHAKNIKCHIFMALLCKRGMACVHICLFPKNRLPFTLCAYYWHLICVIYDLLLPFVFPLLYNFLPRLFSLWSNISSYT